MNSRMTNRLMAAFAVLVPLLVYLKTMAYTVPFWDAGEFISVSRILGIPHPPGTPLFVLTGHLFGLLPFGSYAFRVNLVSVVTGMITILFTYLLVQKCVMHLQLQPAVGYRGAPPPPGDDEDQKIKLGLSYVAGITGAWFTAFSHSFWNTSTEIAHVHVGASAIMFFSLWTAVNWWERQGEDMNERRLLTIWYMLCVGIGWHLGGFLVLPAVVLFALVVDWKRSWWMGTGVFILALWLKWTSYIEEGLNVQPDSKALAMSVGGLLFLCIALHFILKKELRPFLWLTVGAFLAGISVHAYLVIRAHHNPMINEAAPNTWSAFWDEFTRKQYAPASPLERSANWTYQLDYMFFRYFKGEFVLGPPMESFPGVKPWTGMLAFLAMGIPIALGEFGRLYQLIKGRFKADTWVIMHLAVWILAVALYQFGNQQAMAILLVFLMHIVDLLLGIKWKQQLFVLIEACFLIGSLGLIVYLNFKDPQVRERDYFFLWGYEAFTVWMGIGVIGLIHEGLKAARITANRRALVGAFGLVGILLPIAACAHFYFEQDHTGNYVARDYAYNMLMPLAPDAIIFTNGDNDTFPLWYLQEVEGIRTDVRIVNLSLLNTNWYIKQLRDLVPKVPIRLQDHEVDGLEPYRDADGSVKLVKDIMVAHIVDENRWKKPIYLAVTVPEQMGLDRRLSLEGLAFRVLQDSTGNHPLVNLEATRKAVYETYLYRGLLDKDGNLTPVPYKDDNQVRLAGNYSAAHVRLAFAYREKGEMKKAFDELDRAERISPDFAGVAVSRGVFHEELGDTVSAIRAFEDGIKRFPDNPEINYRLGVLYALKQRYRDAFERLEVARRSDPENTSVIFSEFTLLAQMGQADQADQVMRPYLDAHPEDQRARQLYNDVMRHLGRPGIEATPQGLPQALPGQ